MKVTVYKCNLCELSWEKKHVLGVDIENVGQGQPEVVLVDPEDSDKHVCKGCITAIRAYDEGVRELENI